MNPIATHPVSKVHVRVEINEKDFWRLYKMPMHPINHNIAVLNELRKAGIPVDGGVELRGVLHGRMTMFNERREGSLLHVYEWAPGADSKQIEEDDEL